MIIAKHIPIRADRLGSVYRYRCVGAIITTMEKEVMSFRESEGHGGVGGDVEKIRTQSSDMKLFRTLKS